MEPMRLKRLLNAMACFAHILPSGAIASGWRDRCVLLTSMSESLSPSGLSGDGFGEPRMVTVPEGNFLMGSETGQDNERPIHTVWIDASSWPKHN